MKQLTSQVLQVCIHTDNEVLPVTLKVSTVDGEVDSEPTLRKKVTVGETPNEIDSGVYLVAPLGCLIIQNVTGRGREFRPTAEELAADAAAVIHIETADGHATRIPPGRFVVLYPSRPVFSLRSEAGEAAAAVLMVPAPREGSVAVDRGEKVVD